MRRPINAILYLVAITLVVFYGQVLLSKLGGSGGPSPRIRAEDSSTAHDAYYSLREVAALQLDQISVTYAQDETSGLYTPRFRNNACPNLDADPKQLKKDLEALQDELHEYVLLLVPCADIDHSGFVTEEEGARFKDLVEFGNLTAHCFEKGAKDVETLARAAGLEAGVAALKLQEYQELVAGCPAEIRARFPLPVQIPE